jgi:hypothetical protein
VEQLNVEDLNKIYDDAEMADKDVFAEQRSNILLVAGDHYTKNSQKYLNTVRTNKDFSENQKLRLTKNHTYRISHIWKNSILAYAPGVAIKPQKETEAQDRKDAQLNSSVYQHFKHKERFEEKFGQYVSDFVDIGECAEEILFDPNDGEFQGYEQAVGEDGQPQFDEVGEMVADETKPVFKGKFVFNRIFAFNLLRESSGNAMRGAKCWIVRDMVSKAKLKKIYAQDSEKLKLLEAHNNDEFIVFDASKKGYEKTKDSVQIRKFYWPTCTEYPEGYFVIATSAGILEEGPLPGGIFPINWACFDEHQTNPRGRSIIKQLRPYQAEINRASSQMAMHQITIGDDKILYQSGTKLAAGALLPGVRGLTYQGAAPEILPGRDGSQFLAYIQAQIDEMYRVSMVDEAEQELTANMEPYTLLYRSMSQQKKFKPFAKKFEQFLIDRTNTFLALAKFYLPDDELIVSVGRGEMVNIAEFRKSSPLSSQIIVEPQDDTIETKLGRQLTFTHLLQYSGGQLDKEDIGKVLRLMPYGNVGEGISDLTLNYDIAENAVLALERGEQPEIGPYDDNTYMVKRLTKRMRDPDFKYLAPEIQESYKILEQQYNAAEAERQKALMAAKNEYIPADGPLIACDLYVENADPAKEPKRARVPERALSWLMDQLEAQGMNQDKLASMNQGALAEMANLMMSQQQPQGQLPPGRQGQQVA